MVVVILVLSQNTFQSDKSDSLEDPIFRFRFLFFDFWDPDVPGVGSSNKFRD